MSLPPYRRRTGICLNMIVKNETPVLDRLFQSLRNFLDYYVIVDTGSEDGTPEFINRWMDSAGIPGEVHRRPWVNFGANRDEALQLAVKADKADWLLIIDADEEFGCSDPDFPQRLVPGVTYRLEKHHGPMRYELPHLVDIRENRWRWRAPVHEYLEHVEGPRQSQPLSSAWIIYHAGEGARSRGKTLEQKYLADAALLEEELVRNPNDFRSRFYLAQSYRDAGHLEKARDNYRLRAQMKGGWPEETYWAQYEVGALARRLKLPRESVVVDLLDAYNMRPTRGEALHELAVSCRLDQRWGEALLYATLGAELPKPADSLFVMKDVYDWRLLDELSVAAYWAGFPEKSRKAALEIFERMERWGIRVPEGDQARIRENVGFAEKKLQATSPSGPLGVFA